MGIINYKRLLELTQKNKSGSITSAEKHELMYLLYENGSITEKQYKDYESNKNSEEIFEMALTVGGIILFGYLISLLAKK
jgi:hypothetical protein